MTKMMTDMLAVSRAYEASQAIKMADEAARRAVDEVGRIDN
ncbi:MAG: hypothetical protein U0556_17280 [Dehalococcoidia bacterium]